MQTFTRSGVAGKVEDKGLPLNGLHFHYRDWGDAGFPSLVILHGFTHHSHVWDTLSRKLSHSYHVLVLDQRGHGETDWSSDYSDETMLDDVEAFTNALGLKKLVLLGHSMGGSIAYVFAARYPNLVERLILVESGPPLPGETTGSAAPSVEKAPESFHDPEEAVRFAKTIFPMAQESELRNQIIHNLIRREDSSWAWRYDRVGLRGNYPEISASERWGLLSRVSCPTLLILGAGSSFSRERANRMIQVIPDCRVAEISESGHSPPRDNPEALFQAVWRFLEK